MKTYKICRKKSWEEIPAFEISDKTKDFDADILAWGKLCYDEEALHVRLRAREADIRAEQDGCFDMPCKDSCLEFFFCPDENSKRYFNIEMNPKCSMFLGIGTGIKDLARLRMMNQNEYGFDALAEMTGDGWMITYRIPYRFIRLFFPDFEVFSGKKMRGNAYKCGDLCSVPHGLSWSPIIPGIPHSYHNPDCFGTLIFE